MLPLSRAIFLIFFLLGLASASQTAVALDVPAWRKGAQAYRGEEIGSERILFVTHASQKWDANRVIERNLNQRILEEKSLGTPVHYLIHEDAPYPLSFYYLQPAPTYFLVSAGGEHRVKTRATSYLFAGGFFYWCLRLTFESAMRQHDPARGIMRAFFLADSIYVTVDGGPWYTKTLEVFLQGKNDEETMEFLRSQIFQEGPMNPGLQLSYPDRRFLIFRDGRNIGFVGNGRKLVELHFP